MATARKPTARKAAQKTSPKPSAKETKSTGAARSTLARPKLTDLAYEQLEEAIITLRIPPGSVISELTLSEMLNIGRTPIREAIQRLAREHLLLVLPQRGLLVPEIDLKKQLKLLETRREVERLICRSAARRATPEEREVFARLHDEFMLASKTNDDVMFMRSDREFNEMTLVSARNEFAEGAMRLMHGLSRRFWYIHYKQAADLPEMARLHAKVAGAIAKGEIDAAGEALDRLLDNIESFAKATLTSDM
ncbi:GntR family transcriptional regulator [Oxalicibacterium flavum]|uniref:GntR family transcriptional regulator n=1 Tax=Oxalicibacterium flavum TaxID=179467 RepID=A0A8J2ULQ3_9BURK|nr:GntR family transcriptional regulator [Oxalicibacterium flavum]GGC14387.1 GntR family transcriptional regulator [Oxalicibacterium flavum]